MLGHLEVRPRRCSDRDKIRSQIVEGSTPVQPYFGNAQPSRQRMRRLTASPTQRHDINAGPA
jgi:hypothetical protein